MDSIHFPNLLLYRNISEMCFTCICRWRASDQIPNLLGSQALIHHIQVHVPYSFYMMISLEFSTRKKYKNEVIFLKLLENVYNLT